jgi:predicted XRE-type DNA-binding protein
MPPAALGSGPARLTRAPDYGPHGAATLARHRAAHTIIAGVNDASDPVPALKQQLARAILDYLGGTPQGNMARRLGVDQPRASNLEHGQLQRFSLQQLVRFVAHADGEVTLSVTWRSRRLWIIPPPTPRRDPT